MVRKLLSSYCVAPLEEPCCKESVSDTNWLRYLFFIISEVKPWSQGWLIAAGAYPGFCSMKRLEVFLLPLDGMLVHRRSLPRNFARFPQQFAGTHLYTWVDRGTVRVKCLAQEHNTMAPARARTIIFDQNLVEKYEYMTHRHSQGGSWGARDPPFVSLLVSKQLTIFR